MKSTRRLFLVGLTLTISAVVTLVHINKRPVKASSSSSQHFRIYRPQEDIDMFLAQPIRNVFNFSFVQNPRYTCEKSHTDLLLVVPSAPGHFARRDAIRKGDTFNYVANSQHNAKLLFFIGMFSHDTKKTQQRLVEESRKFGDIVQMNFEDSYKNILLKAVSMLKWTSFFCKQTKFVARIDDDVEVVIPTLLSVMEKTNKTHDNFILGIKRENEIPNRDPKSRWGKYYMPYKEFSQETYPPYLIGGLLGYPIGTVQLLYQAALRVKPIWLDDVFITGLCAPKVKVPIFQDPDFRFKHNGTWAV